MTGLSTDLRREMEIRRYPLAVYVLVPLASLVLQAWLPRVLGRFAYFDLPLLVVLYFSLVRRHPIHGTLLGAALGIFQDALTQGVIGIHGIANTVCGFLAASIGIRFVVENVLLRVILNFLFTLLAGLLVVFVSSALLGLQMHWSALTQVLVAAGNALIGLVLFPLLDRLQVKD